jgi:hypothetical protein
MPSPRYSGTIQHAWISIGTIDATAAGADITLGFTERKLQSIKALANVVTYIVPKAVSAVKVRFLIAANNHDVDIGIWQGVTKKPLQHNPSEDCSLMRKATLDVINGQQDVQGSATLHFADTINIANDAVENGIDYSAPGADHMATIHWDLKGDNVVCFHGFGTFDGDCTVQVAGYS